MFEERREKKKHNCCVKTNDARSSCDILWDWENINIKYKLKFMFAERNQNQQSLTPGSHLWTNSSNYLEKKRGVKIDFIFWLQSNCDALKKI